MNNQLQIILSSLNQPNSRLHGYLLTADDVNVIIPILEKEVPKAVVGIKASLQNKYCPNCYEGLMLEYQKNSPRCPECGQTLLCKRDRRN